MDWSAPHIGFVLASYGFSAVVLGGLIIALLVQNRAAKQRLSALEERQTARRKPAKEVKSA